MDQYELSLCLSLNKYSANSLSCLFFTAISRLGNGVFWYALILALPLVYGQEAIETSIIMTLTGIAGVILYKLLKNNLVRQRPCISHQCIHQATAMLDLYSFPSGHTLHAFSFCIIAVHAFPELGIILIPFTLLIAASRVVLGLHYPTDVAVGALIGTLLAVIFI